MKPPRLHTARAWDEALPADVVEEYQLTWDLDDPQLRRHFRWIARQARGRPFWFGGNYYTSAAAEITLGTLDRIDAETRVPTRPRKPPRWPPRWPQAPAPLPPISPTSLADRTIRKLLPVTHYDLLARQAPQALAGCDPTYLPIWYLRRLYDYLQAQRKPTRKVEELMASTAKRTKATPPAQPAPALQTLELYWEDAGIQLQVLAGYLLAYPDCRGDLELYAKQVHETFGDVLPIALLTEAVGAGGELETLANYLDAARELAAQDETPPTLAEMLGGDEDSEEVSEADEDADEDAEASEDEDEEDGDEEDGDETDDEEADDEDVEATAEAPPILVGTRVKFQLRLDNKKLKTLEGTVVNVSRDKTSLKVKDAAGTLHSAIDASSVEVLADVPSDDDDEEAVAAQPAKATKGKAGRTVRNQSPAPDAVISLAASEIAQARKHLVRKSPVGKPDAQGLYSALDTWECALPGSALIVVLMVADGKAGPYVDAYVEDPQGEVVCALPPRQALPGDYVFPVAGEKEYLVRVVAS